MRKLIRAIVAIAGIIVMLYSIPTVRTSVDRWIETQLDSVTSSAPTGPAVTGGFDPIDTPESKAAAIAQINALTTADPASNAGYDRDSQFGTAWTDNNTASLGGNGCDTRNDILERDLTDGLQDRDCSMVEGTLADPYTGETIVFAPGLVIQIDHIIPLSYAWQHGAESWTQDQRVQFANDPLNLVAVDGPENQSKSDQGPGTWMPPQEAIGCAYSARFAEIADEYGLTVDPADIPVMLEACR